MVFSHISIYSLTKTLPKQLLSGGAGQLIYSVVGLTRAIPWIIIGAGIGASIGLLRRDKIQAQRGALGGAIGGLVGGLIVDAFLMLSFTDEAFALASQIGIFVTGAMIGLFMRVVQDSLQSVWLLGISTGPYEGKQYPLNTDRITVGRSELNDISLYRASELAMQSGALVLERNQWTWQGEAAEINGSPQTNAVLNPGDTIKLGGTQFRFQTRSNVPGSPHKTPPLLHPTPVQPVSQQPFLQQPMPARPRPNALSHSSWVLAGPSSAIQMPPAPVRLQLGRAVQNQIVITDESVSSNHAALDVEADALIITDLNSTNGTYINGQRIQPGIAMSLRENDRLILGREEYTVQRL